MWLVFVICLGLSHVWAQDCSKEHGCKGDPYAVLGVSKTADEAIVIRAYRRLARKWHPDRAGGDDTVFRSVANAYGVLKNATQREILDRLGEDGLQRLRDGDPSVRKGWIPAEEVLRRVAGRNDPPEEPLERLITSTFAALGQLSSIGLQASWQLRVLLGLEAAKASVVITATESGPDGAALDNGGATGKDVVFMFSLSGRSKDFQVEDVRHNCGGRSRFLGMKSVYYLECFRGEEKVTGSALQLITVWVEANAFRVEDKTNGASEAFTLSWL